VRKVILLGAGASVPFGIPDMKGFVDGFEKYLSSIDEQNLCDFLEEIENALQNSQRLIGTKIEFDLESLMIVLQDLTSKDRPISIPTLAFMIYLMSKKDKKLEPTTSQTSERRIAVDRQGFSETYEDTFSKCA